MKFVRLHFALTAAVLCLTTSGWSQENPVDANKKPVEKATSMNAVEKAPAKNDAEKAANNDAEKAANKKDETKKDETKKDADMPSDPAKETKAVPKDSEKKSSAEKGDMPKQEKIPEPITDLSLLGEFVGQVDDGDSAAKDKKAEAAKSAQRSPTIALQLRPVGNDQFDGLSYVGGLPGEPGCELKEVTRYIGRRNGDTLILSGGKQAVFVDTQGCTLIDAKGRNVGRLNRTVRVSKSIDARPPEGAIVIFNGKSTDQLSPGAFTDEGNLKHGSVIAPMAQDFDLHVEFKLPIMFDRLDQARGNSGLYLQSRYECQVLDSFATLPVINGSGAIYQFKPADLNAALPPTVWQTYDIRFTAPRWNSSGVKTRNARISSWLNGIQVQNDVEVKSKTGHGAEEEPTLLPTKLQDHNDAVQFRNVWMIDRGLTPGIEFPVWSPKDADRPKDESVSKDAGDSKKVENLKKEEVSKNANADKPVPSDTSVTSDLGDATAK